MLCVLLAWIISTRRSTLHSGHDPHDPYSLTVLHRISSLSTGALFTICYQSTPCTKPQSRDPPTLSPPHTACCRCITCRTPIHHQGYAPCTISGPNASNIEVLTHMAAMLFLLGKTRCLDGCWQPWNTIETNWPGSARLTTRSSECMELGVSRRSATAAGALSKRFALLLGPQFDVPVAQSSTFLLLIKIFVRMHDILRATQHISKHVSPLQKITSRDSKDRDPLRRESLWDPR